MCFVCLFFVQNVFDQRVYREVHYVLSEPVLEKLGERGLVTEDLAGLKDTEYRSAKEFLEAFQRNTFFSSQDENHALRIAEVRPIEIDGEAVEGLDEDWLTAGQLAAVKQLAGVRFDHVWQLRRALANLSPDWRFKEATTVNKLHNQEIERKIGYLVRYFEIGK